MLTKKTVLKHLADARKEATAEELMERDTLDTKGLRIALLVNIAIWAIIYFVFIN
jgi:hypothetical protein